MGLIDFCLLLEDWFSGGGSLGPSMEKENVFRERLGECNETRDVFVRAPFNLRVCRCPLLWEADEEGERGRCRSTGGRSEN
jgi:hypothetical protein